MNRSHAEQIAEERIQISLENGDREKAFWIAVGRSLKDRVEEFLAAGISVNLQNRIGQTALMSAALMGDHRLVKLLLDHGADVHIRSEDGGSPLHFAVAGTIREAAALRVVKLLLEAGAGSHKEFVDDHGYTPYRYAQERYTGEILSLLSE